MTDIVNGLLLRGREVLMAHRSPLRKNYPGSWSFPGGHVEHGETDVITEETTLPRVAEASHLEGA